MALCLATSLLECEGFDPADQMRRYVRWWRGGYMSCVGECFDIGNTIRQALSSFEQTAEPYSGSTDPLSAGNGSIMRLAPVPMFYAIDLVTAMDRSGDSSRTTHGAEEAVDACRYLGVLLGGLLGGKEKGDVLNARPYGGRWAPAIAEIARGSFSRKEPPEIKGTGYVVDSLEAALWAFHKGSNFREGCLLAVNLGDDADTTGAVFGQLAGACYGASGIPSEWLKQLAWREEIAGIALGLERAAR